MGHTLETCPSEVIEEVVKLLDWKDIQNLRLTGKEISTKASQGRFRGTCLSKYVDLTNDALRAFTTTLQSLGEVPRVKHLYLVGLVPKKNEPLRQPVGESHLLVEAFNEIAKRSTNGRLESLTLRMAVACSDGTRLLPVEVNDNPDRVKVLIAPRGTTIPKNVWSCAAETWKLMLRALAASELRVENINAFNEADMHRCSIPCDHIGTKYGPGLAESVKSLKSLSLSICDRVFHVAEDSRGRAVTFEVDSSDSEDTTTDYHAQAAEEENFVGIAKLIELCPRLEDLNLHYFHMYNKKLNVLTEFRSERILQHVVELDKLPRLTGCTLRGLSARGDDLLDLIARTRPERLSLQTIQLCQGRFAPIIEYCGSDEAGMKALLLDTLYEPREGHGGNEMVHFDVDVDRYPAITDVLEAHLASISGGSERLQRDQDTIKLPIPFFVSCPWFIGSPFTVAYRTRQRLEYG